jgi:hypothetical protein
MNVTDKFKVVRGTLTPPKNPKQLQKLDNNNFLILSHILY